MDQKTIDIEKILKGKLGSKAKFVPASYGRAATRKAWNGWKNASDTST